jgi:hypothetical protein
VFGADAPAIIRTTVLRSLPLPRLTVAAALLAAACAPASARAAELYAAPGGSPAPAPCSSPGAPCSLAAALLAARGSAGADVVNLAPGTFAEVISATGEADTDVTLRGAGIGVTTLSAPAVDSPMVQLGAIGNGTMAIEGLTIDATPAGATAAALRSRLAKLSLTRVRVVQSGATPKLAPAIDADASSSELVLDQVEVVSNTQTPDNAIGAVNVGGPLTMRDSTVSHSSIGDSAAVYARGDVTILRSTITHGDANAGQALRFVNTLELKTIVIDSSLLIGGNTGARLDVGTLATTATLRGVTIAPFATGNGYGVNLNASAGGSLARATVSSSLLVGRSVRVVNGAQTTCTFTNLPTTGSAGSPNCPATGAGATAAGNTGLATAALKLGTDFIPAADSPAIDSGDPAGVAAGESPTDRLGRLRAGASADACDAGPGRRDKGAFERYRPRPAVAINGPDSVAAGVAAGFSAAVTARDPAYAWSFGDGAAGGDAATTSHAFAARGSSSVTLTVTDRAWNCAASAAKPLTVTAAVGGSAASDRTAPKVTKAKLAKATIGRGKNATLSFTLSEAATVTVTVGRIKGKKLTATRKATFKGKKGANRVTLSAKKLKLRKGRYGLRIGAKDASGNSAKSIALKLRVR